MINYKILKYKFVFRGRTLLYMANKEITEEIRNIIIRVYGNEKTNNDKLFSEGIIIETEAPKSFPKFNEKMNLKIKGYNVYKPKITHIFWTEESGWKYNFENVGHTIQWIKEENISHID